MATPQITQPGSQQATGQSGGAGSAPYSQEEAHAFRESAPVTVEHEFLKMQIDQGKMYIAPLPIMSGAEDRDSEITNPDGLIADSYKTSRPVYFNHSHAFDPMSFPIGTCETPSRQFDLHRTQEGWSAGTLFSQSTELARQTFALVCEGVIRGRSIGAMDLEVAPYRPTIPMQTLHEGRVVERKNITKHHKLYEMVEFSWTPMPSNRDMVTMYKSVLSRGRVDGAPLDPFLRRSFASLDLSLPRNAVNNLEKSNHRTFTKAFDAVFRKGTTMSAIESPLAIRFDASKWTPARAAKFLKSDPDLFPNTETTLVREDGNVFLRSNQVKYSGPIEVKTDSRPPFDGVQLIFAKGGFFNQGANTEEEVDGAGVEVSETEAVQRIVQQATGEVHVEEPGAQPSSAQPSSAQQPPQPQPGMQAPAAPPTPEAQGMEAEVDEQVDEIEQKMSGPLGAQFLQTLMTKLAEVLDQAEASTDELEPEMVAKCGEFMEKARGIAAEIGAYKDERYGGKKQSDSDMDDDSEEDEDDAMMTKSIRRDLFYGKRIAVPEEGVSLLKHVSRGLDTVNSQLIDMFVEKCVQPPRVKSVKRRKDEVDELVKLVKRSLR